MQFSPMGQVSFKFPGKLVVESVSKKDKTGDSVGTLAAVITSVDSFLVALLQHTSTLPQGVPNSASY